MSVMLVLLVAWVCVLYRVSVSVASGVSNKFFVSSVSNYINIVL